MEKTILGRTGLEVTAAGLGCGGFSRLGIANGIDHASGIVRSAYENGVNFFDTAAIYGTQAAVGKGLEGLARGSYVISSKFPYNTGSTIKEASELEKTLNQALSDLHTDYIDVYNLHGVTPQAYQTVRDRFYPELVRMKDQGRIRHIGITELFGGDNTHEMLKMALADDLWDVIMVGYNLLNPSAAKTILPVAKNNNVGTVCMFAVRRSLSDPAQLKLDVQRMIASGQVDTNLVKEDNTIDFLVEKGYAETIMEAAYRYCRHSGGIDVTLTGTGSAEHLLTNLKSLSMPPLPREALRMLERMFGNVDCVSGQQQFPGA
jgi:aryl-alcohol dehydrogenase-like predicted oxidoreductase